MERIAAIDLDMQRITADATVEIARVRQNAEGELRRLAETRMLLLVATVHRERSAE